MLSERYKILIVDDHPLIVEGYKSALKYGLDDPLLVIDTAFDCEEAVKIMDAQLGNYEIVLLDISLPLYKKLNLSSGEDLGLWIRKEYPDTKLFVLTSYSDPLRLNSIIHSISPEGFFIKSEATSIDIVSAIKNIRNNKIALGPTVSKLVLKKSYTYSRLDDISLQILKEISNGTKTVNLPQYIPLSKSGIEKRKRLLKLFFKVKTGNDRELIMNAKKSGYL